MILIILDRDGTLIEDSDYLGKTDDWKDKLTIRKNVLSLVKEKQKAENKTIVVTNQSGVARNFFDCERVEEVNSFLDNILKKEKIIIDNWQYCPDADTEYAKRTGYAFNEKFLKETTKRKPSTAMVEDALQELNMQVGDFSDIIVIGDSDDDEELANNLKAKYVDANEM